MGFDWLEFYKIAEQIYSNSPEFESKGCSEEGLSRTVINRSYYALLQVTAQWMVDNHNETFNDGGGYHREVITCCTDSNDNNLIIIGRTLDALKPKREGVDYKKYPADVYPNYKEASNVLRDTRKAFSLIS